MAFTAATSQTLVEAAREALIKTTQKIEQYIQVNNPGNLASLNTQLDACEAAIAALQA
jgi:hypothetical protein